MHQELGKDIIPSWWAPIFGTLLPFIMAAEGLLREKQDVVATFKSADWSRILLMAGLGFLGGMIIWAYDRVKKRRNFPK